MAFSPNLRQYASMKAFILLILAVTVLGAQTQPYKISSEEAVRHLVRKPDPVYPPLAERARIQGNVVLDVRIDENGKPSVTGIVRGHPMLVQSAKDAVNRSLYRPFEVNGNPGAVSTLVMVTFGRPYNDAEDRAELQLDDTLIAARMAVEKGDYKEAEKQFGVARQTLGSVGGGSELERWQLSMAIAEMAMSQKQYDTAAHNYQDAVNVWAHYAYLSPQKAEALAKLGTLHREQKHYDGARDTLAQSAEIYQSICKKVSCSDELRKQTQRKAAYEYWDLSRIAVQQNNPQEAANWCKKVLDARKLLDGNDGNSILSSCQNGGTEDRQPAK